MNLSRPGNRGPQSGPPSIQPNTASLGQLYVADSSLESDAQNTGIITGDTTAHAPLPRPEDKRRHRRNLIRLVIILLLIFIGLGAILITRHSGKTTLDAAKSDAAQRYNVQSIPLTNLTSTNGLTVQNSTSLSVNGQLNVNNGLVLAPTGQPTNSVAGQLYFDQTTNTISYYNGTTYKTLIPEGSAIDSIAGATGKLTTGSGISVVNNQLSNSGVLSVGGQNGVVGLGDGLSGGSGSIRNTGVLSVQGQAGNVSFTAGGGIAISGTTLSSTGVLALGGQNGSIAVGNGLSVGGGTLRNTGVVSAAGSGGVTVTNDGNGNLTISSVVGGSGTVSSPGGTANKLARFTGAQSIADSLIDDNGTVVTVGGDLSVTGNLNLTTALSVSNGGTGASNSLNARTNLGAAASGANSDITSLSGLTSALSVAQGGTGVGTFATNGVVIGNGSSGLNSVVAGASGLCLVSTGGAPTFAACPGSGGVASVNGLSGAISLSNASGSGSTITIDDASTSAKGIASFNATNFLVTGGTVNTVQDIAVTATPAFAGLTLATPLGTGSGGTGANTPAGARSNLGAAASGANTDITSLGGLTTAIGVGQGGTGATTATAARSNLGAAASGANSDITSLSGLSTALSVSQGGTGLSTLSANQILFASSSSAISQISNGSSGLCLMSNGAGSAPSFQTCTGAGGVASLNGQTGGVTVANATGASGIVTIDDAKADGSTKGIAAFNSTNFSAAGGVVNTIQGIATSSSPTFAGLTLSSALTVGNGGTGSTTAAGARSNLGAAASGANSDISSLSGLTTALSVGQGGTGVSTLATNGVIVGQGSGALTAVTAGGAGLCLVSTGGAPTFASCPGSGGVSTVNGLSGAINIANASGSGATITIDDASTSNKGIASFNGTNFSVVAGAVNTVQNINTAAAPQFGQLTLTSSQAANPMLLINNTNVSASGNLLDLQLNGSSKFSVAPNGNTVVGGTLGTSGTINGQTVSGAANFTGSVTVGTTLNVNTITPSSALTIGANGQSFTLQGNTGSSLKSTNGTNTTTVAFQNPTSNVTYSFAATTAGAYDICTTAGNCTGVGGGITGSGTAGNIAKFSAGGNITDSIITDNGTTVTIGGALAVNTITPSAALTVGSTGQNLTLQGASVSLSATNGGNTNSLVFATPGSGNKTITLPNASGTVAVSASGPLSLDAFGNLSCATCLSSGGGGAGGVSSVNTLTGALVLQGVSAGSISSAGSTLTVNDASSSIKGLASFNATNLTVSGGAVNTVQDIAVGATPTFAGLSLSSALTVGNGGTGATTASGARSNLGAAASGANSDITSLSGLTTALSVAQGGTGVTTTPNAGQILIGNGSGYSLNTLTAGSGVTIDSTSTPGHVTISAAGAGTCAGCANQSLNNLASVAINTSLLPGTAGGADLGSSALPFGQLFLSGTSASPATNGFKITGASTGGQRTITLPDASGTVAVSASGNIVLSAAGNITFTGQLAVANGGTGATTATAARSNLGAAASGSNSDITSLSGLSTALSVSQGGTGISTLTGNQLLVANAGGTAISQLSNGSSGLCLMSNGAGSAPSFQTCTGAGGVSSVNSLTGNLTVANSTGSGSTITIDDAKADGSTKGIAAFNSTNFSAASGVINTVQDIATSSNVSFNSINSATLLKTNGTTRIDASGNLSNIGTVSTSGLITGGNGLTISSGTITFNNLTGGSSKCLTLDASNHVGTASCATGGGSTPTLQDVYDNSGASPVINLGTTGNGVKIQDASTPIGTDLFAVTNSAGTTKYLAVTVAGATVTGTLAATSLSGNGSGVTNVNAAQLNGQSASYYLNASNISAGTLGDSYLSSNVALYNRATSNFTGSLQHNGNTVCDTSGNCTGVAGGAVGGSGTLNKIPVFTGSGYTIGDSMLSQNVGATQLTIGGNLVATGTVRLSNYGAGVVTSDASGNLNSGAVDRNSSTYFNTALSAANGGTGANNASSARSNLGAAASGSNSDITSLTGLSTALTVAQGGTGLSTLTANQLLYASSSSSVGQINSSTSGLCLVSNGSGSAPSFQTCTGAGGVSSLNGQTGAVTLNGTTNQVNVSNAGSTFTLSTPQDINTTSSVTFNNVNATALLKTNGTTRIDASGNLNNIGTINASGLITGGNGLTISSGTVTLNNLTGGSSVCLTLDASSHVGTASCASGGTGSYIQNQIASAQSADFWINGSGTLGGLLSANNGLTALGAVNINTTGTAATTIGNTTGTLTLQGGSSVSLSSSNGSYSTALGFSGTQTSGNINYNLDRSVAAGNYTICTSAVSSCGGTTGTYVALQGSWPGTRQTGTVNVDNINTDYAEINGYVANSPYASGFLVDKIATSSTNDQYGSGVSLQVAPTAASTAGYIGSNAYITSNSGYLSGAAVIGTNSNAEYTGSGTVNYLASSNFQTNNSSSGTITNAVGSDITMNNTGSGTITNADGLHINSSENSGGGTITNNYGAYVEYQYAGTNDYGMYIQGADTASLYVASGLTDLRGDLHAAGQTILGSSSNQTQLIVKANASQSASNPLIMLQSSSGTELGRINIDSNGNSAFGNVALANLSSGGDNTAIGSEALRYTTTGYQNTAVGSDALLSNVSGYTNVAVGAGSLQANSSGNDNVAIGAWAMNHNNGAYNVGIGSDALYNATNANNNVSIGIQSLLNTSTGYENVALGNYAGQQNTTGYSNTYVGTSAGDSDWDGFTTGAGLINAGAIGAAAQVQASNSLVLGSIGGNGNTNVGIGTTIPTNTLSVSPIDYNTGTASQSGSTVTGVGTSWTSNMIGEQFIFADGSSGTITGVTNATHLTLSTSQTVSSRNYRIHHIGFQVTGAGNAYVQNTSSTAFQVQNNAGSNVLTVDTNNPTVTATGNFVVQGGNIDNYYGASKSIISATATSNNNAQSAQIIILTVAPSSPIASYNNYNGLDVFTGSNSANVANADIDSVQGQAEFSGGSGLTLGSATGGYFASQNTSGGTITSAVGSSGQITNSGGGTIGVGDALWAQVDNSGSGTISQSHGLRVLSATNTGGGTISQNFGVYVENQTAGASDYGVYIQGADTAALYVNSGLTSLNGGLSAQGTINLNASANYATNINTGTSTGAVTIGNASAGAISLQSGTSIGLTGATTVTGTTNVNTTGSAATSIGNSAGGAVSLTTGSASGIALTTNNASGGTTVKSATSNSSTAFQVQNAAGTNILGVDTTNSLVSMAMLNVGSPANVSSPQRVFSDDFEDGNQSRWYNIGSNSATVSTSPVHGGKYSASFNFSTGNSESLGTDIDSHSSLYARAYVNVNYSATPIYLMSLDDYSLPNTFVSLYYNRINTSSGTLCIVSEINGTPSFQCTASGPATMQNGQWYEVEMRATMGTPGVITAWLNGVQVQTGTPNVGNAGFTNFQVGDNSYSRTGTFSVDDVSVDTTRNGDAASVYIQDDLHVAGSSSFGDRIYLASGFDSAGSSYINSNADWSSTDDGASLSIFSSLQDNYDDQQAQYVHAYVAPSAPTSQYYAGINSYIYTDSGNLSASGNNGTIASIEAQAHNGGTGTVPNVTGVNAETYNDTTGTITDARGINVNTYNAAGGTIGSASGIVVNSPNNNGTINDDFGIYVANQTAGTNSNYGLYLEGAGTQTIHVDSGLSYFGGDIQIGAQSNSGGTTADYAKVSNTTAGTICSQTAVDAAKSSAVYNGSLYIGTSEQDKAEVCRYTGGSSWTLVNAASGTFSGGWGSHTNTDTVASMAVWDGNLYIGTTGGGSGADTNKASLYRYDGGTTFTFINGTQGNIGGTTNVDSISAMTVFQGSLMVGTSDTSAIAAVYVYLGGTGTNSLTITTSTAGTFDGVTGYKTVNSLTTSGSKMFAGVGQGSGTGKAAIYNYDLVAGYLSVVSSGSIGGITGLDQVDSLVTYNGILYYSASKTAAGSGSVAIGKIYQDSSENYFDVGSNATAGQLATTTGIDRAILTVYNGTLYAATQKSNAAELYTSNGFYVFTKVSNSTAGTIVGGGTSGIDGISVLQPYNNLLFMGTSESNKAEMYTYNSVNSMSHQLLFQAASSNASGTQYSGMPSTGSISFAATQSGGSGIQGGSNGQFMFSNSISTTTGSYDVAEDYATRDSSLQPGDLVTIDPNEKGFVRRSTGLGDNGIVGVYSTDPALRLSQQDATINGGTAVPIALAGRVPLKVSTENGPILPGDPLMASSQPGVAMKATGAGRIIGMAMEGYSGTDVYQITVFVNPNWYTPSVSDLLQTTSMNVAQNINVGGLATIKTLHVSGDATFDGKITADNIVVQHDIIVNGHIVSGGDTPTVSILTAGGSNTTATIKGTDTAGSVSFVVKGGQITAPFSLGEFLKVTFNKAYNDEPHVSITPVGSDSAKLQTYVDQADDSFNIGTNTAPQNDVTYKFNYQVIQ